MGSGTRFRWRAWAVLLRDVALAAWIVAVVLFAVLMNLPATGRTEQALPESLRAIKRNATAILTDPKELRKAIPL